MVIISINSCWLSKYRLIISSTFFGSFSCSFSTISSIIFFQGKIQIIHTLEFSFCFQQRYIILEYSTVIPKHALTRVSNSLTNATYRRLGKYFRVEWRNCIFLNSSTICSVFWTLIFNLATRQIICPIRL